MVVHRAQIHTGIHPAALFTRRVRGMLGVFCSTHQPPRRPCLFLFSFKRSKWFPKSKFVHASVKFSRRCSSQKYKVVPFYIIHHQSGWEKEMNQINKTRLVTSIYLCSTGGRRAHYQEMQDTNLSTNESIIMVAELKSKQS